MKTWPKDITNIFMLINNAEGYEYAWIGFVLQNIFSYHGGLKKKNYIRVYVLAKNINVHNSERKEEGKMEDEWEF